MQGAPQQAQSCLYHNPSTEIPEGQTNQQTFCCTIFQKLCLQTSGIKGRRQVNPQENPTHLYRHARGPCPTLNYQEEIPLLPVVLWLELKHRQLPHFRGGYLQTFQPHIGDLLLLWGSSRAKRTGDKFIHIPQNSPPYSASCTIVCVPFPL